jgi:hypothetical protein
LFLLQKVQNTNPVVKMPAFKVELALKSLLLETRMRIALAVNWDKAFEAAALWNFCAGTGNSIIHVV